MLQFFKRKAAHKPNKSSTNNFSFLDLTSTTKNYLGVENIFSNKLDLVLYVLFKYLKKNIYILCFRILPCYAVLLMLGTNMMPYLGEGPRWSAEIKNVQVCKKNWWSNVLFISNFYRPDDMVGFVLLYTLLAMLSLQLQYV